MSAARLVGLAALAAALASCHGDTLFIGTDCLASGTGAELQAAIDTRKTVLLCERAEITLSKLLVLRQGLTLFTVGHPTDATKMATIRLGPDFPIQSSGAVRGSGSDIHLESVRFDGNRRALGTQLKYTAGIPHDIQPWIVAVPKTTIAASYQTLK